MTAKAAKTVRTLLPLFLDLDGRDVLVVGAGEVAARKIEELVNAKARVRVVAPLVHESIDADAVKIESRRFEAKDVDGAWLVIAATDDEATQQAVAEACEKAHVFCVAVDDPKNASAYGGGVVRRGPTTIAISTSGEAPALARLLREMIEEMLPGGRLARDGARPSREVEERRDADGITLRRARPRLQGEGPLAASARRARGERLGARRLRRR